MVEADRKRNRRPENQCAMLTQIHKSNRYFVATLALCLVISSVRGQAAQFPQVYYNAQGSGGFNLTIRQTASSSGTAITTIPVNGRIGAESLTTNSSGGETIYNWIRVCMPRASSTNNTPNYGYMGCNFYYMRIHESTTSTNHATVATVSTPLGVRTTAGGTVYVTIGGSNAYYGNGSIVARTGLSQVVSTITWYQVYLPNNCSQGTGWVSGQYLTIPSAPNFKVVGGNVCDNAGTCSIVGNINGALVSFSGGNGSTRSSEGFYQYKLTTGVTTTITCTATGFTTSTPISYNHTASSHNYTRQFVMSNVTCSYSLSPSSNNSVPTGGGSYSVSVTTPASCAWTATESLSWVSITSGASGTGNGTVNYTVSSNGGSSRSGTMTIGGQSFQITQAGVCTYGLSPTSNLTIPVAGGGYSVGVSTQSGCAWTATESLSWVSITSGASGTGSGTVNYTVSSNAGISRSGTLTIAGQSFQVTQAGVAQVSYTLSISTQPEGGFLTPKILTGSLIKICADGSKATIVTVTATGGSVNMQDMRFRITNSNTSVEYDGAFNNPRTWSTTTATTLFTHPSYLDGSVYTQFRENQIIEVYNVNDELTLASVPVRIVRAPMLFVHGLWGDPESFTDMKSYFDGAFGPNIYTRTANYEGTNYADFYTNRNVVGDELILCLVKARDNRFSVGKVDVVAHSMGGVLARIYLIGPNYRGDMRSLTTINTPHRGTQSANLLKSPIGLIVHGAMNASHRYVGGAVTDLRVNSQYFDSGNLGNGRQVPSLSYNSTSTFWWGSLQDNPDWFPIKLLYHMSSCTFNILGIDGPLALTERLYLGDASDPIVPQPSQVCGMVSDHNDEITHTQTPSSPLVYVDLRNRLGTPLSLYNLAGYQSGTLSKPWWLAIPPVPCNSGNRAVEDSVVVLQPMNGGVYAPGNTVNIEVSSSEGMPHFVAAMLVQNDKVIWLRDTLDENLTSEFVVPEDLVGDIRLIALAIDMEGRITYDSLSISVPLTSILDSIRFATDTALLQLGTSQAMKLMGYVGDSLSLDITVLSGVNYQALNPSVLGINPSSGMFTSNQLGTTDIVAQFNGLSDTLHVSVHDADAYSYALFETTETLLCGPGDISFSDVSQGAVVSRSWFFPGGTPSTASDASPTVNYSAPGSYDVELIVNWANKADTISVPGYVMVAPPPSVDIGASGPTTLYQGETVDLTAIGTTGIDHYFWSILDTNQVITVSAAGEYEVRGVDDVGCSATASLVVEVSPLLKLSAKVFLDGPYDSGQQLMADSLRAHGLIPLSEPYTVMGYVHIGGGNESVAAPALFVTGNNAIVDWIVVELRDESNPSQVLQTRSALLQRDGDVVSKDGVSPVGFSRLSGDYFVAIRHRNHLGVMTLDPVTLSASPTTVDFTDPTMFTYGSEAEKNSGARMTLWAGNANWDNKLKYVGLDNDRDPVLVQIGGSVPTNTVPGYYREDVNMDGVVKYVGSQNDRDPILVNIGGSVPTQVRLEQLP